MAYKKKTKNKKKLTEDSVVIDIKSTFNNTIISVNTLSGDNIARASAGNIGFKGSKKSTPFAATQIAMNLATEIKSLGAKFAMFNLNGPGAGREAAVRAFMSSGIGITGFRDVTPIPHNGCRPRKRKRN